jgi:hypothetical protein
MNEHRHQWSVVDFYVDDDTPMMRQACTCGAERAIRAWDRSWEPSVPSSQADQAESVAAADR